MSDIENAYITAPCTEKIWTVLGPEFGSAGKSAIVVRALYGLKSAGASFCNHPADCMMHLGFTPCLADPDLWMRPEVRPSNGVSYYAYTLLYVDDVLVVHHYATDVLLRLDKYFKMKPRSIGDPDIYLGATIKQMRLANGVMAWASSPWKYVWALVDAHKRYGVCPRRQLILFQGTMCLSWIPPQHSTQSCRRGMPLSLECSDGWLRSVEWISSPSPW